ncbi:MAG: transposase [Aridibacter sp.]|jgi:transposase-like protein|nr:transposase [Gemmatimonadota bacterium]
MKRKYDAEFKRNAVQKVLDGQTAVSVARELGVGENLIYKWKRTYLQNGNGVQSSEQLNEIEALKKRNRELEMELEIIKKAALIFGREKR